MKKLILLVFMFSALYSMNAQTKPIEIKPFYVTISKEVQGTATSKTITYTKAYVKNGVSATIVITANSDQSILSIAVYSSTTPANPQPLGPISECYNRTKVGSNDWAALSSCIWDAMFS